MKRSSQYKQPHERLKRGLHVDLLYLSSKDTERLRISLTKISVRIASY